ncbi:MAG: hypothetical protein SOU50_03920 [Oscillospiraceae bacterium]|nr:hypothetical protein [Oscillospiraceae bacterium]MDY2847348.1 hypothetical protein [Oscillospiraceae bacterium]
MKRKLTALLCGAAMMFLTSCGESDLNATVFVTSMGVSLNEGEYTVSVYGSAARGEETEDISASGTGRTAAEALINAAEDCKMELFLGHCTGIAANSAALRDSAMLAEFAGGEISPACPVYFSDSPGKGAENIPAEGFGTELYELSVFSKNGVPAVIPVAEDPERVAVLTAQETILTDSEDSLGIMILRGEAVPRTVTVSGENGFETVTISPETKRSAYYADGVLHADMTVELNISEASEQAAVSAAELIREICISAYVKLVNDMGIDAVGISSLTGYNEAQLTGSRLVLTVE